CQRNTCGRYARMIRNLRSIAAMAFLPTVAPSLTHAQQVADSAFDVSVQRPAFTTRHPVLVIDEAHRNFHTSTGRYLVFASLMRNDGFDVRAGTRRFDSRSLRNVDVLVVANALVGRANANSDD